MTKRYWILESRGYRKAWTPEYVCKSAESAEQALGRLRRFDARWKQKKERRAVAVSEIS